MAEGEVAGNITILANIEPDKNSITTFTADVSDDMKQKLSDALEKVPNYLGKSVENIQQAIVQCNSSVGDLSESITSLSTTDVLDTLTNKIVSFTDTTENSAKSMSDVIKSIFSASQTSFENTFAPEIEMYSDFVNKAIGISKAFREGISDTFPSAAIKINDFTQELVKMLNRLYGTDIPIPDLTGSVAETLQMYRDAFVEELGRWEELKHEFEKGNPELNNPFFLTPTLEDLNHDIYDLTEQYLNFTKTVESSYEELGLSQAKIGNYADKELEEITKVRAEVLKMTQSAVDGITTLTDTSKINDSYADLKERLTELKTMLRTGVGVSPTGEEYKLNADEMYEVAQAVETIKARMKEMTQGAEPLPSTFEQVRETINPVTTAMSNLGNIGAKVGNSIKNIFLKAFNTIKSFGSKVFNTIKGKITGTLKSAEGSMKRFTKKMLMVGLGVRGIMMAVRKLRTMVLTSFKDLANGASEFAETLNAFTTAWTQVKGSIATAFQPIASVVLPILTQLCNRLSAASVELAKFFATLTGQKYVYQFTAANKNLDKSIKGTGKSAKEANKSLAQYDKLIVIPSKNDTGAGGGGGAGDASKGVYQKLDIGDGASEFAEKVKEAWKNSDFTEVGQIIGQKLRSALLSIPWSEIQVTASNIGKDIATLINGAMTPETFGVIGNTLGQLLNTIVSGATGFINNFDWGTFGTGLANGLNNLFNSFNIGNLGTAIGNLVNGIFTLISNFAANADTNKIGNSIATGLYNAIATIDASLMGGAVNKVLHAIFNLITVTASGLPWDKLGSDLAKFLNSAITPETFVSAMTAFTTVLNGLVTSGLNFIKTYNWAQLGVGLGSGINTFIKNTDWAGAGSLLGGFIQGLIKTIHNTITTTDWSAIGTALTSYVNGFLQQIDLKELGQSASDLANGLLTTISTAIDGIDWSTVGSQIVGFIAAIDWLKLLSNIVKTTASIAKGIKSFIAGLVDGISDAIKHIGEGDFDMEDFVKTIFSAISSALEGSAKLWTSLIKLATTIIKTILKGIIDVFGKIINGEIKWEDIGKLFTDLGQWIVQGFTDGMSCDWWQWLKDNLFNPIYNGFKSLFGISSPSVVFQTLGDFLMQGLKNGISAAIAGVVTIFTTLWGDIKGVFDFEKVKTHFLTVFSNIKSAFNGLQTWFATTFGGAWAKVTAKFNLSNVLTHFQNVVLKIKSAFTAIKSWFSNTFGEAWKAVKEKFAFSSISQHFKSVVSNIKSAFSGIAEWFRTTFSKAWTKVKEVFSTGGKVFTGIKEGIATTFKSVVNKLIDGINTAIAKPFTAITSMVGKIRDASVLGAKPFYDLLKNFSLSAPKIPKLAQGAVIPPNKEFLAVLGDQKKGTNIETPLETMMEAFRAVLNEGGRKEPIVLQLPDGRIIAEIVWDEEAKRYKQTSNFRPQII